jgi:hypothetical protein
MALSTIQWIIFVSTLVLSLLGAAFNGIIAWREWYEKESDGPSAAPLIFGAIGVVAVLSAPFGELSERIPFLWIPIVFDYGTGPYFLLVAYTLLTEKKR